MMFEYFYFRDLAPLIMLWIGLVLLLSSFDSKKVIKYATAIIFILAIIQNIYQSFVFEENVKLFNENKKLKCSVKQVKYLVEKSNGVSIQKHYFVKDQLLILIVDCEEF